jgi:hypothetical protein
MSFDSDVALLGTGVAPLIAAKRLLEEGKSVLLLNPDWDFFQEDSELPLDPLWPTTPETLSPQRLLKASAEHVLAELRPEFPGPIESWPRQASGPSDYHDELAPHVRYRDRLWIRGVEPSEEWEAIEDMYVEASDAGLNPQVLEGLLAYKRFPGAPGRVPGDESWRGVLVPRMSDVDVSRYRNGLLEFVRDRLDPSRIVCAATQIEVIPDGIRFHAGGTPKTARLKQGMLVFWTPRLSSWVLSQAKRDEIEPECAPLGIRLWEEWSLVSREKLDPGIIGSFHDLAVWAEIEGVPTDDLATMSRLSVLRPGPLMGLDAMTQAKSWAGADSFDDLSRLCHEFLRWEKFSIRALKPRGIFEWASRKPWTMLEDLTPLKIVPACDGPIVDVVRAAREACEGLST